MAPAFRRAIAWLNGQAVELRAQGYSVELQHAMDAGSVRLRVQGTERIGEIVLWDGMVFDEIVCDVRSGEFVHERFGQECHGDLSEHAVLFR